MKDFKLLLVVVFFTLITYWGIEPLAHSQLNPAVAPANFVPSEADIELATLRLSQAKSSLEQIKNDSSRQSLIAVTEREVESRQNNLEQIKIFWDGVNKIDFSSGDAIRGEEVFASAGCTACHGVKSQGIDSPMEPLDASQSFGVIPPDLSHAGLIYDDSFLAALILNPAMAQKVNHRFNDNNPHPMSSFFGVGDDINKDVSDIVAYLKFIAPKNVSNKEVFVTACKYCHDVRYDNLFTEGDRTALVSYMATTPPDLSMMIRSKGRSYLETFINDPQKHLDGTAMPRVGLTKEAQDQVIDYLESVGDSKKAEREKLGYGIMIFFVIFSIFAYAWKVKVWRELH